jgi:hypothetical protein
MSRRAMAKRAYEDLLVSSDDVDAVRRGVKRLCTADGVRPACQETFLTCAVCLWLTPLPGAPTAPGDAGCRGAESPGRLQRSGKPTRR